MNSFALMLRIIIFFEENEKTSLLHILLLGKIYFF